MKVLVVGYGSMGVRHARHAEQLGHEVAVLDTQAEAHGDVPPRLLRDGDPYVWVGDGAVVVATPARTHAELLWTALRRTSARVYVEKPLALSERDFYAGAAAAGYPDVLKALLAVDYGRVAVGYNLRFHDGLRLLRDRLPTIGPATWARLTIQCDKARWPGRAYEDMLLEASHELDLARWLLGDAEVAGAVSQSPDQWSVLLRHACGVATAVVLDGTFTGAYRREVEVSGVTGTLRHYWRPCAGDWLWTFTDAEHRAHHGATTPDETSRASLAAFLCAAECHDGGAGLLDGTAVLRVCDAVRASLKKSTKPGSLWGLAT